MVGETKYCPIFIIKYYHHEVMRNRRWKIQGNIIISGGDSPGDMVLSIMMITRVNCIALTTLHIVFRCRRDPILPNTNSLGARNWGRSLGRALIIIHDIVQIKVDGSYPTGWKINQIRLSNIGSVLEVLSMSTVTLHVLCELEKNFYTEKSAEQLMMMKNSSMVLYSKCWY